MKRGCFFFFLFRNLRRRPGRTATAVLAIAFGIGIFHLLAALSLALHSQVIERIETIFPERSLLVRRRSVELGPIAVSPKLLIPTITPDTVRRLAALPGVEAVWPILPLRFPVMVVGSLAGYEGSSDVIVYGVPAGLVRSDVTGERGFSYADPANKTVPVIIPRYFMDMFNIGMAESQSLPKLTDKFVVGKHFQLWLGVSLLTVNSDMVNTATVRRVECEIVGLTRDPSLLALVVPIEYVRRFNRRYLGERAKEEYVQMNVVLRSPNDYETVSKQIEAMGLDVVGHRETAQRLRFIVTGAVAILLLFGSAVLAMAMINIINTFALIMLERRSEIGLFRAVGATRRATMSLLVGESLAIGLVGGLLGSGVAWATARFLNEALVWWLPTFSLAPDYWFDARAGLFVFCIALASIGSALAPAPLLWRSVRRWPAQLLRDS